jgi:glycosyltransferase involved in cell wall biosynthesis
MNKKRILWVSEASFLATGFSVLSHEILSRLYKTNKYEIAELGSYAKSSDPRSILLPWKFYGAEPEPTNTFALNIYNQTQTAQFGEAVFEQVCLDFKPDIVVDVRDWWMCEFQLRSPFRKNYKLVWMPTVDGEPQRLEWLDSYARADLIVTYTKYGKDVLEREAPGKIKVFDIASPGVNHKIFYPMDKTKVREELGINPNANIIMAIMRNQRRKLFPDLIEAFKEFLQHCDKVGDTELAKKTYLYLHTSYPDMGFDIPRHLMDNGVGHKTFVTYTCERCKAFYSDFFQGEFIVCKKCGALSAHMPTTEAGLTREGVAKVLNVADLYIQYSICEGFGMPIAEAKACGVPALGVNYTATAEQVNVFGCKPIRVEKFFHEPIVETEQRRALPDKKDTVEKIYEFFKTPQVKRDEYSKAVREEVVENHSFDRAAKVFERALDSIVTYDRNKTWLNPERKLLKIPEEIPNLATNAELIDWCIDNIVVKPELKSTYWRSETIKSLNVGFNVHKGGKSVFDKDVAVKSFVNMANVHNYWENKRLEDISLPDEDHIKWHMI